MKIGERLQKDNFIKRYFVNPYLAGRDINERIEKIYLKDFARRYNINFYTFNTEGKPLKGIGNDDFERLNNEFNNIGLSTVSDVFRYLPEKNNRHKYMAKVIARYNDVERGILFIEIIPKIYSASSAYPELLVEETKSDEIFDDLIYAIYNNDKLVSSNGDYEYTGKLTFDAGNPRQYIVYTENDYNHLLYRGDQSSVVILTQKIPSAINTMSFFSYTFCFFLFFTLVMGVFGVLNLLSEHVTERQNHIGGQSLQQSIQTSMIGLVLMSLMVIGLITLIYFQKQYDTYHNGRLLRKVNTIFKNINTLTNEKDLENEENFISFINDNIDRLSKIHSLDINAYNTSGYLTASSHPDIFKKNLVSKVISPKAYLNLNMKGKQRFVTEEKIGRLNYLSAYLPFNRNGNNLAYLHFPYYSKQKSLRSDISYFIVALVNVYVILILIATIVAALISRSITTPLSAVKDSLSKVQLGRKNKPIEWKNNDEIGLLVAEYNRMLRELEESAELLAKSERETAWREMAKQVAHEIKNPLTPMKLSIQHLQRAITEGGDNIPELTMNISQRLIEQIDNLSHIASEFSSFAKMPVAQREKIELVKIIRSSADIFKDHSNISIQVSLPDHPCYIIADRNQILRVFNNLFKNAVQAIPEETLGFIEVTMYDKEEVYHIEIKDNGVGIAEDKALKVFEPNFTTKNSGTGLGLAISKNIIEKSEGRIWFDSEEGVGTSFFIALPKLREENE